MKRREMLSAGFRRLVQAVLPGAAGAGGLADLLWGRRPEPVKTEVASFPREGGKPRDFCKEG